MLAGRWCSACCWANGEEAGETSHVLVDGQRPTRAGKAMQVGEQERGRGGCNRVVTGRGEELIRPEQGSSEADTLNPDPLPGLDPPSWVNKTPSWIQGSN